MDEHHKTPTHFAKFMGWTSRQRVYEQYKRENMGADTLLRACRYFGISLSDFLQGHFPDVINDAEADMSLMIQLINKRSNMIEDKIDILINRS